MDLGWRPMLCCLALLGACGETASSPDEGNAGNDAGGGGSGADGGSVQQDAGSEVWIQPGLTGELLSAKLIADDFGETVRFVGLAERGFVLADTLDGRLSFVIGGVTFGPLSLSRLPETHHGFRVIAVIDDMATIDGYVLACGYERCGLFEAPGAQAGELIPLPGSEFSGGPRYRALAHLDVRLCASGPDVPTLCFDGESWTDEAGAPADPEAVPGVEPPAGRDPLLPPPPLDPFEDEHPASCPSDSEITEPLLASRVGWDEVLRAVTASGRIVYGRWNGESGTVTSCVPATEAIAPPVDFEVESCGLYTNPRLLTESQLLGPTDCAID